LPLAVAVGRFDADAVDDLAVVNGGSEDVTILLNTDVPTADVSISQTDSPDPVAPADPLTYTLTARNAGPNPSASTTVTDVLPAGVSFVSAIPSQGSCLEAAGTVTCDLGTLPVGSATITISVTAPAVTGMITNTASISTSAVDPFPGNNSREEVTQVLEGPPRSDIGIEKSVSSSTAFLGGTFTYTLTVTNSGPFEAPRVEVTDTLPSDVTFVSVSFSRGTCMHASGTVTCDLGPVLRPGGRATITIQVKPTSPGSKTNCATAVATDSGEAFPDPDETNNTDCVTKVVVMGPIAYASNSAGNPALTEIYRIEENRSGNVRLTNNQLLHGSDMTPAWNSGKTKIAFASNIKEAIDVDLYTMYFDGSGLGKHTGEREYIDMDPDYTPDNLSLVFVTNRYSSSVENFDIARIRLSNNTVTRLTSDLAAETSPSVCPDGRIVYVSTDSDGNSEIMRMNADGTGKVKLTDTSLPLMNVDPSCSPDGTKVAYSRNQLMPDLETNFEIMTMDIDGANQTRLTNRMAIDFQPSWRPDGQRIVFSANATGGFELWLIDPDGSGLKQLTFTGGLPIVNLNPDWS
jgi:uncharacterized repeat protein (TIGR01451 family)